MPGTFLCLVMGELSAIISFPSTKCLRRRAAVVHVSQSDSERITC